MVEKRLNELSSDEQQFNAEKQQYEEALKITGYKPHLMYKTNISEQPEQKKRHRGRKIFWFNPPYNSSITTNFGRDFLKLVDKHLSNNSVMKKFFNRNTIKISYSCMPNMSSVIASHNKKILGQSKEQLEAGCNCRKGTNCPLEGKCLTASLIYKATVEVGQSTKYYIGQASTSFKTRYNNHKSSFKNQNHQKSTKLSGLVWKLKEEGQIYNIKWNIISLQPTFDPGSNKCQLCLMEKVMILESDPETTINKRNEIFTKCPHRKNHLLVNM